MNNGQRIGLPEELRNGCVLYLPGDVASNTKRLAETSFYNDANLVRYYTMDDLNEKNGNTLTNSGCSAITGKFAGAYSSGSSNSSNRMYNSANLGINGGACTITAWIKLNSTHTVSDHPLAVSEYSSSTGVLNGIGFNQGNTAVQFSRLREAIAWEDATYSYSPGTSDWHFYCYTFNGSTVRGYVDGVLVTSASASGSGSNIFGRTTGISILANDRGGINNQCSAQVDDVAFFTRALSDSEISSLYGQMVAFDASGSGNNGTLVNSPTVTRGGLWGYKGLTFNGTNQYVVIPDANSLDFGTGDFSFSLTVKLSQLGSARNFVSKMNEYYNGGTVATGFNFGITDVGYGNYSFSFATWESNSPTAVSGSANTYYGYAVNENARMHFIRRGTQLEIWLNGTMILSNSGTVRNVNTSYPMNVGRYNWTYDQYFYGIISNVLAHNRALAPNEIRTDLEAFFTP